MVFPCGARGVHLSLLPMPQRLAVHLSSINHRERLLSPSVAIVSGPETVLGCAVASREEEKEERKERKGKERRGELRSEARRGLYKHFSKGNVENLKRSRGGKRGGDWKSSGRLTHGSSHYGLECFRNQNGFHFYLSGEASISFRECIFAVSLCHTPSQTHTVCINPLCTPAKLSRRIFWQQLCLQNSTLTSSSSLLQHIELLLFHLGAQCLPLRSDRRRVRGSCFMLSWMFWWYKSCGIHVLFSEEPWWKLTTGNFHGREYPLLWSLLCLSVFICLYFCHFSLFLVCLFSFIIDSVPLIKCCYIQREDFSFFLSCP